MRTAGVILDIYDDPKGLVLRQKLAGEALPEKLASSELLEVDELNRLPDRLFGLVAVNDGHVIRKYAMHDENHLVTSMIYFLECGHLLPQDARVKVAGNLVNACAWYDVDPPEALVKVAIVGAVLGAGLGAAELAGEAKKGTERKRQQMDEFRKHQTQGSKIATGTTLELSLSEEKALQEGKDAPDHVGAALKKKDNKAVADAKLDEQTNMRLEQVEPHKNKQADLTGTEVMPQGALSKSVRTRPNKKMTLASKTAAARLAELTVPDDWEHCGDLSGREPAQEVKEASYSVFALPHRQRYPIETVDQVKTAAAYFDEHKTELSLLDRRVFSQSLHIQSENLGVKVAGSYQEYAGNDYGPFIHSELLARANSFRGTGHENVYEVLQEKQASVPPMVMVELLKEADDVTGASASYGRPGTGFRDPYAAVYGAVKAASDQPTETETYSWNSGSDYVNGFMLEAFADSGVDLDGTFGDGFWESFKKDPVGIFKSMPEPQKVVLSRMASDNAGTSMKS